MKNKLGTQLKPGTFIETDLTERLDRLPWSNWHWRVVIALGITWVLDGLEVTIVGSLASVLAEKETLNLSEVQIGSSASAYLAGAVIGSLLFGRLTDALGRKRLFLVSLAVYLAATVLTAFSWNFLSFAIFRALTGAAIGGEYSAINSAIDELIPARVRGRVDLAINSTFWIGTALGAASTIFLLDPQIIPHSIGWRICFLLGALLSVSIVLIRRYIPESPRWLILHGYLDEASAVVREIEAQVQKGTSTPLAPVTTSVRLEVKKSAPLMEVAKLLFGKYLSRTVLGISLMTAQAFAYNAIFFTYALILSKFYGVPAERIGFYIIPFAVGNFLGPMALGHLFDSLGRRAMIAGTYFFSGILLFLTGYSFAQGWLSAETQTALWCVVFFVASAAASSAYLTVSELFPVDMRGLAIAIFYSIGTGVGGIAAPWIFGMLIQTGSRENVFYGYLLGALLMIIASVVALFLGVAAEGKSLEHLSAEIHPPI
ncbi:MAG: MFS transporter [Bacteriovoracia bacterium]